MDAEWNEFRNLELAKIKKLLKTTYCTSCHPELFNIKKKTTESLRMSNMIKGESCGVCHLFVAFPLDDCKKCHPNMRL